MTQPSTAAPSTPSGFSPTSGPSPQAEPRDLSYFDQLAPGVTVEVRNESWLVTHVARSTDGFRIKVRGLSDYVRDSTATFFTALDDVRIFDPAAVTPVPDNSPHFRHSKLWLESTMRQTPVPLRQQELDVATRMLADPLDYQLAAVRKALDPDRVQPRILLADAVGLGKTLEIGMIAAELIRRGRGERILVVTPKHVLEQFQQELWTRFAIPLVRLDSVGIQKVRQKLPASKNPFTYFPRVIVSMDTLKSPKYLAQLEKVNWDIVIVDEIHNATNAGTHNNRLVRTLAPRTDALILASATPHNGDPDSFKEILRLLDPLSVSPSGEIDEAAANDLIIRRHRNSTEVASVVGDKWAIREEPTNILIEASEDENAVARELNETWVSTKLAGDLFPWTLVKAYLSSPAALLETIDNRIRTLTNTQSPTADTNAATQVQSLQHLRELAERVTPDNSNKYFHLVDYLANEVDIKKGSSQRVVIFSERVATLHFLEENLTKDLKLGKGAVRVMHGGMSDVEQMELIDEFKRADSAVRVLVTGDVASEGVNLHSQCHHLVHYDIPWSLIRIQQRNGRIDRYGQTNPPQIATLLLDPEEGIGETHVLEKLVEREHAAHQFLGDASLLMGKHSIRGEEDSVRDILRGRRDLDSTIRTAEEVVRDARERATHHAERHTAAHNGTNTNDASTNTPSHSHTPAASTPDSAADTTAVDDLWAMINSGTLMLEEEPEKPQASSTSRSLFDSEQDYLVQALAEAFHDVASESPARGGVAMELHDNDTMELTPPRDLQRRFDLLPQDYVEYRQVKKRLMLATSTPRGESQLQAARERDAKTWPKAHFLGPLHPVSDWAADRALSSMSKSEIPAFTGAVDQLTVLLMATLTSSRGQVVTRSFLLGTPGQFGLDVPEGLPGAVVETITDPIATLREIGLNEQAISTGSLTIPPETNRLIRAALDAAETHVDAIRAAGSAETTQRVDAWSKRAAEWESAAAHVSGRAGRSLAVVKQQEEILKATRPQRSLIRPLAVIIPSVSPSA
ncbi:RNA polymerase-associated protein RapA [Corynebacterium ciconiae DSM 44920]|uniref:DEAD/DEAH box helicase n=1 Tax=Corynebacterium ciconiae TaxID=227319 RepID=UPI000361408A|nr:DEAD/DEAH box helicase [Corynebacterium ciconiae]WKD60150.1 RNA polymerase-associated protein RapA [Corynebacterium ciconiae DSM 44920]